MPKREDISKILIIGAGPVNIGQAGESDSFCVQACGALKSLGYQTVMVDSNPAAVSTGEGVADITYIEPLSIQRLTEIIEKERPDALLPIFGGQSGLNLCRALDGAGVLARFGVQVLGSPLAAIERCGDRIAFVETMRRLKIDTLRSFPAYSVTEAESIAKELGFPVAVRPAYTTGGAGGGIVYNIEELFTVVSRGIAAGMIGQVLVEEAVPGWEELELELLRDHTGRTLTVARIENIDPMGVHSGDSVCVTPMLTIPEDAQKALETAAVTALGAMNIAGGANVRFARDPATGRAVIIEINPFATRSAAFASAASGLPVASVSSLLAAGLTLDELPREYTQSMLTSNATAVKFPRWDLDRFPEATNWLGTQMKSTGQIIALGTSFKEALQKAVCALETGRTGLGGGLEGVSLSELLLMLSEPTGERQFVLYEALKKGASIDELHKLTQIKPWYLEQLKQLAALEETIFGHAGNKLPAALLREAKENGFSDVRLATLLQTDEASIRKQRLSEGIVPAAQQAGGLFLTYSAAGTANEGGKKLLLIGGGPNRIGHSNETAACCAQAAKALRALGYAVILAESNPAAVSAAPGIADLLYLEPLTAESIINIYHQENVFGVITQFGGAVCPDLAAELAIAGLTLPGVSSKTLAVCSDINRFTALLDSIDIPYMDYAPAAAIAETVAVTDGKITYVPAVVEHIELSGVNPGDSACILPAYHIEQSHLEVITGYSAKIAGALGVKGLLNLRFIISEGTVYASKAQIGASRAVPLISKIYRLSLAEMATRAVVSDLTGDKDALSGLQPKNIPYYCVKEAVFPFAMLPEADPLLGLNMRSTGEALGISSSVGIAFCKAQEAAQSPLPQSGSVFISVNDKDKTEIVRVAQSLHKLGFDLIATRGTCRLLNDQGIPCRFIKKLHEGRPNIADELANNNICLVINTPESTLSQNDDSYIRKTAVKKNIPYITTMAAAKATANGLLDYAEKSPEQNVKSLEEYYM